ncbi:DUF1592 domain-containing protein [Blastopirellula marina]|uniref:Cytochrome c domain-containing protein n=1 Tax=Blastopirellula marina TaxID=124 RepID=A0A2S8F4E7_9BACT|nr:DUF1592 domain-containing protein [Blastopirellula marina]PQO26804.1 hypothetical protein C5Y98_28955 [Blastopirellula marina]PQO41491.1 hypothetical protein C5Y93_30755 [Blastopirellula marina]PTL41011.1 DUF1592 domain-containing protein [Blastopirellula marina]
MSTALMLAICSSLAADPARHQATFDKQVKPFLTKYCNDCHAGDFAESGIDLASFNTAEQVMTTGRKTWQKTLDQLAAGAMPPKEETQPSKEELAQTLEWIRGALADYSCDGPVDPGRETIRRLNRNEYENTIRDLVGVDFKASEEFPADDVGYGFDNIGDVLSLSPLLLEKYYDAAEIIADKAIITDPNSLIRSERLKDFKLKDGSKSDDRISFASHNVATTEFDVALPGEYKIAIRAFGTQAGDQLPNMHVKLDDIEKDFAVDALRGKEKDYEITKRFSKGKHRLAVSFTNDFYDPDNPDRERRDRNLMVNSIKLVGPPDVKPENFPESHREIFIAYPGQDGITAEVATRRILTRFASRAFRRPATADEVNRLYALVSSSQADGASFEESIRDGVIAILCSPNFLFRVEMDESKEPVRQLNEFELASRLSYFLWSSAPDKELLGLAFEGKLRSQLDQQIDRMMKSPKSSALVENFAGQWLQLRNLESAKPDRRQFRTFTPKLAQEMRRETELFFDSIMRDDRSILDLIGADYTFLNESLAKHYGIKNVSGEDFRKVSLDDKARGGILSQASILTVTSNPTRTSPVKRGKWILENVLGTPPPDPPADVPTLEGQKELKGTLRERMAQHMANPSCASCHARMDPIGFALENFDAVGAFRTKDEGQKIDASGELPGGIKFEGADGLRQLILKEHRDEFVRTFSEKMLTYALGRGVEYYDMCAVDAIQDELERNDYRFSALVKAIVHSDPFQKRRTH